MSYPKCIYIHIFHIINSNEIDEVKLYPYHLKELPKDKLAEIIEYFEEEEGEFFPLSTHLQKYLHNKIEDTGSKSNYIDYWGMVEQNGQDLQDTINKSKDPYPY